MSKSDLRKILNSKRCLCSDLHHIALQLHVSWTTDNTSYFIYQIITTPTYMCKLCLHLLMTFAASNSCRGNMHWEPRHGSMPPSVMPSRHFLILSGPIAFNSLPLPVTVLFQGPISFALLRMSQASQLDRLPSVSENKYPRDRCKGDERGDAVRAKAAPRDYEKQSVPKSGAQIKRANAGHRHH